MRVVDYFCGSGGFTLGATMAGQFELTYEKAEEKLECDSDFTIAAVFDGHIEEAKS